MKFSEMITKDMHNAHRERLRRIFFEPLKTKLTNLCVAKLVEQGSMSEKTARDFFSSAAGDMMLHTLMGSAIGLLRNLDFDKKEVICNELEVIHNAESYDQLIKLLQPKQNVSSICPCGITRSDCTYHK
jgi:hypothetical protein